MNRKMEISYRDGNIISIWPQHLLCLRCLNGEGRQPFMDKHGLLRILDRIKKNPSIFVHLQSAFDEVGARTEIFGKQTHIERKRDLDVLQKLGLVPGSIRTARDLYKLIEERIPELDGICTYNAITPGKWDECPLGRAPYFKNGKESMIDGRSTEEMLKAKIDSCNEIENADRIFIRAHHLLCITCFIGSRDEHKPLAEDNLYELWRKMQKNPEISVTVVEGCSKCMICPPCPGYEPQRGICNNACHLRDRKKDLDVFQRLGLIPGDTLPAQQLVSLLYERIPTVKGICFYGVDTSPEWKSCGSFLHGSYEKGRESGLM